MRTEERDLLEDLTDEQAKTDPNARGEWETMKLVADLTKARKDKGLTQGQIAERMGVAQQRVAEIERRPWGVGFARVVTYARAIGVEVGIVGEVRVAA